MIPLLFASVAFGVGLVFVTIIHLATRWKARQQKRDAFRDFVKRYGVHVVEYQKPKKRRRSSG